MVHIPHLRLSGDTLEILENKDWYPVTSFKNIVHVASLENYSILCFEDGQKIVILCTMKYFMKILKGKNFLRIHKQTIVNTEYATEYHRNILYLSNSLQIPIGRKFKKTVSLCIPSRTLKKRKSLAMAA